MKKILVVVDMQNDFVDGALGTAEAVAIVPQVVKEINEFDGEIIATYDTHSENYLETAEGKKLPVTHCVKDTKGWQLNSDVQATELHEIIRECAGDEDFEIELIGLCTDICVVSNALLLKANFYENKISVKTSCCAGVSPATHNAALDTMRCCQIDIV